jgi:hypothetical protein
MNHSGHWLTAALCAVALLGPRASAQEAPKNPADVAFAKQVNHAIDEGVKHLRGQQAADGSWPHARMGATALAALALLEAGVDPNDPAIQWAAEFVRKKAVNETYSYSVCTTIMFLDRLGDPQDSLLIQHLGARVLFAQVRQGGGAGGWGYDTAQPGAGEVQRLNEAIKTRKAVKLKAGEKREPLTVKDLPGDLLATIQNFYRSGKGAIVGGVGPDNSNMQFALIALWAARRHGLPVEKAFTLAEQRLRRTQTNGGWSYIAISPPNAQMTCCGLIGLGLAYGAIDKPAEKRNLATDPAITRAFSEVGKVVGKPYPDVKNAPRLDMKKFGKVFYTLWTLERAAVLFDLKTIHGKDWYRWGAQILLANQQPDGSWPGEFREGCCDTSFALLFLKRANLTADMTHRVRKDPRLKLPREVIGDPETPPPAPKPKSSSRAPRLVPRPSAAHAGPQWERLPLSGSCRSSGPPFPTS